MSGTRVELHPSDHIRVVEERLPKGTCGFIFLEEEGIDLGQEWMVVVDNYIGLTWCQAMTDLIALHL